MTSASEIDLAKLAETLAALPARQRRQVLRMLPDDATLVARVNQAAAKDILSIWRATVSNSTAAMYRRNLGYYADWLHCDITQATAQLLSDGPGAAYRTVTLWVGQMRETLSPATINNRIASLRSLTNCAKRAGYITWQLDVKTLPTRAYRDVSGPPWPVVQRMVNLARRRAAGDGSGKSQRDAAMLILTVTHALRKAELLAMRLEDLLYGERGRLQQVRIKPKGRDYEHLTLPPIAGQAVMLYLHAGRKHAKTGPLWLSRRGRALSAPAWDAVVHELGRSAGARAIVRPHGLRHASITRHAAMSQDPFSTREFARHCDMKTTMHYVDDSAQSAFDIAAELGFTATEPL